MTKFVSAVHNVMFSSFSSQPHEPEQASSQQLPQLEAEAQLHPRTEAASGKLAEVCQPAQQVQAPMFLSIAAFPSQTSKVISHAVNHFFSPFQPWVTARQHPNRCCQPSRRD